MTQETTLSLEQALQQAIGHQQAGRAGEAEGIYQAILRAMPRQSDALHLYGLLLAENGRVDEGVALIREAVAQMPAPEYLNNLGTVLLDQGKAGEAEDCFRQAVAARQDYAEAHNNLGNALAAQGRWEEARSAYGQAVRLRPGYARAWGNLGSAWRERGQVSEALRCFWKALELDPANLRAGRNMAELAESVAPRLAAAPEHAVAWGKQMLEAARPVLEKTSLAGPIAAAVASALRTAGSTVSASLRERFGADFRLDDSQGMETEATLARALLEAAASLYRQLLKGGEDAELCNGLGGALLELGRDEEAIATLRRVLALSPRMAAAFGNLGLALLHQGRLADAFENLQQAILLDPCLSQVQHALVAIFERDRDVAATIAAVREAVARLPRAPHLQSLLAYASDVDPNSSVVEQQKERRVYYEQHVKPWHPGHLPLGVRRDPGKKLRIGYIPGRFFRNASLFAFYPMLVSYDRSHFEVFCYSNFDRAGDDVSQRIAQSVEGFRDISALSDEGAARLIRDDGIDILVDLFGHAAGNRLEIYAYKPAPIIVTAWGHANGTGMAEVDYLFSDRVSIPQEERGYYAEAILDLPCQIGYWCPDDAPPVAPLPAASGHGVTFGCFNTVSKISDEALTAFVEILRCLPGSRLLLKDGGWMSESARKHVALLLRAGGVDESRVRYLGRSSWAEHLAAFGQVDIALDSFPKCGGMTTLDGLWMGVPLVSLRGGNLPGRIGASILTAVGLEDWIADDLDAYIRIAVVKAEDIADLAEVRLGLRSRLLASPLGNPDLYVRQVEAHYRRVWRRFCGVLEQTSFLVTPSPELGLAECYVSLLGREPEADAWLPVAETLWRALRADPRQADVLGLLAALALRYGKFLLACDLLDDAGAQGWSVPTGPGVLRALFLLSSNAHPDFDAIAGELLATPSLGQIWQREIPQAESGRERITLLANLLSQKFSIANERSPYAKKIGGESNAVGRKAGGMAFANGLGADDRKNLITVVIPSKGRLKELESLLRYFAKRQLEYKVLILESGSLYGSLTSLEGLDVELVQYPEDSLPYVKLQDAFSRLVQTPLVCMATDDDFLTVEAIEESARFLLENPGYSACHGYHGRFDMEGNDMALLDILWFAPSIENPDPLLRLSSLIRRYQPIVWAVFRTDVMREAVSMFHLAGNYLVAELMWSATAVLKGKVKRLPMIYCVRRKDDTQLMGHPFFAFIESPQKFMESYHIYRQVILDRLPARGGAGRDELERQFDLIHACYFFREVRRETLEFFTNEALRRPGASIHDSDIRHAMRASDPYPPQTSRKRIEGCARSYAVSSLFMHPRPESEILLPPDFLERLIGELDNYPLS